MLAAWLRIARAMTARRGLENRMSRRRNPNRGQALRSRSLSAFRSTLWRDSSGRSSHYDQP